MRTMERLKRMSEVGAGKRRGSGTKRRRRRGRKKRNRRKSVGGEGGGGEEEEENLRFFVFFQLKINSIQISVRIWLCIQNDWLS